MDKYSIHGQFKNEFVVSNRKYTFKVVVFIFFGIIMGFFLKNKFLSLKSSSKIEIMTNVSKNTWDLKDIFQTKEDFESEIEDLKNLKTNFIQKHSNKKLHNEDNLFSSIKDFELISEKIQKLYAYVYLSYSQDTLLESNQMNLSRISKLSNEVDSDLVFFTSFVGKLDVSEIERMTRKKHSLLEYKPFLINSAKYKNHIMGDQAEKYSSEKSSTLSSIVRFYDEKLSSIKIKHGVKPLTLSSALNLMDKSEKSVRTGVRKKLDKEFEKISNDAFFALKIIIDDKKIDDKYRLYKKPQSKMNLNNAIPDEVVEKLIKAVNQNYHKTSHRYYAIKAKLMSVDVLDVEDRNAPVYEIEQNYTIDRSKEIIKESYSGTSKEFKQILEHFLKKDWIDYENTKNKMSGAYCYPISGVHPYLMLNHFGSTRDLFTFAHELGHGIHEYISAKNGSLMSHNPLIFAETASIFSEFLLFDNLIKNAKTKKEKKAILMKRIEDRLNTVVRQAAFFEFESKLHSFAKKNEVSKKDVEKIWMEVQSKSLGGGIKLHKDYKHYWVYISHFFHSPFYVYSYVFGDLTAAALFNEYKKTGDEFFKKYYQFLSSTSTHDYEYLFKIFNLDPNDQEFWNKSILSISDMIDELEEMI